MGLEPTTYGVEGMYSEPAVDPCIQDPTKSLLRRLPYRAVSLDSGRAASSARDSDRFTSRSPDIAILGP